MTKKKTSQKETKKDDDKIVEQFSLAETLSDTKSKANAGFSKEDIDKLEKQIQEEIDFDRKHRERRHASWKLNEQLIDNEKQDVGTERANIGVANTKTFGFFDSLLSKIDNPPSMKFSKGEDADLKKAKLANAVKDQEAKPTRDNWAIKDTACKEEMITYGRGIMEFHGSSTDGFKTHTENVSVYDFLIDPSAGGLDIEKAENLGRAGIYKSNKALEKGAEDGRYMKDVVKAIVESKGGEAGSKEEKQKNRYATLVADSKIIRREDVHNFWEWYTTFNGVRYYTLYNEKLRKVVRIVKLTDMFSSNLWPFITYAAYPRLRYFWSPAPIDYVREIFMGQGVSINQMLDNSEAINHPMRGVNTTAIKNVNSLKYGRDKIVKFNKGADMKRDVTTFAPPPIDAPIKVYDILESIGNTESGISAATRGVADEEKVGIYEGNIAQVADRIGRLNKSYANAHHRWGLLFYYAIVDHMTQKTAVEVIGENGVQIIEITKDDIMPDRVPFNINIDATNAELQNDLAEKKERVSWLQSLKDDPIVNQNVRFEMEAKVFNIADEEIKRLLDVNEFADADLMSEASRDIQKIIIGDEIEPNEQANTKYLQKIVDYMTENREYMLDNPEIFARLALYVKSLKPIVIRNMAKKSQEMLSKQGQLLEGLANRQGVIPNQTGNTLVR